MKGRQNCARAISECDYTANFTGHQSHIVYQAGAATAARRALDPTSVPPPPARLPLPAASEGGRPGRGPCGLDRRMCGGVVGVELSVECSADGAGWVGATTLRNIMYLYHRYHLFV